MKRERMPFLLTFLAGVVAATIAMAIGTGAANVATAARYDDLGLFTSVLRLVQQNYVEEVDESALIRGAMRGMLQELDPHSSFLDTEAYREMQVDTRGEFHGLGIEITKRRDGFIEVVAPIEGTPAFTAGVRPRDSIVAICPTEVPKDWTEPCHSTKNMTLFEAVQLMRGKKGSEIKIEIFRDGFDEPKQFTIKRDVVKIQSVTGRLIEPGYAYVRVRAFQEHTVDDLTDALDQLGKETKGPIEGLVLDLRDDPGGLLDQAVKVANVWLSDGLIVYTKGRAEDQRQEFRATNEGNEPTYPIAVIVNEGTASASEIVAGALQDQRRALVIGEKTFGKGSVQTVYPLPESDAALRLTTALYYTPSGRSIQEVGITPDIAVAVAAAGEPEGGVRRMRESDLENHFTHEDAEPGSGPAQPAPPAEPAEKAPNEPHADADASTDVQLARALEVLKSWTYFERMRGSDTQMQARAPEAMPAPTPPTQ
jgi:carboxyl-terminal processing protease